MSWIARLRGMLHRDRLEHDLDDELSAHLEMRAADNVAAGMSPEAARCEAQKRFGNTALLKEDTRNADIVGWMDMAARDFSLRAPHAAAQPGLHHRRCSHSRPRHRRELRDFFRHQLCSSSPVHILSRRSNR
jgi:hypothetical protein